MRGRIGCLAALGFVSALCAAASPASPAAVAASSAPTFNVIDLGIVGKAPDSWAISVSPTGRWAAVENHPGSPQERAARWHSGRLRSLGTLGGSSSATDVNSSGDEVGWFVDASGYGRAFADVPGSTMTRLPDLGGDGSGAAAINDSGTIVGYADTAGTADYRAVEWTGGTLTSLGGLGADSLSQATAVNSAGLAAGYSWTAQNSLPYHAVIFHAGTVTDLTPGTTLNSQATGINKLDAVSGSYCESDCTAGAFIAYDGVVDSFDLAMGGAGGEAASINDHWEVVGREQLPNQEWVPSLFFDGHEYDLNSLLSASAAAGWTVTNATRINDQSMIAATATDTATGESHAVLLEPVTTPTYDTTSPTGTASIDGGATTTSSPTVQIVATASAASGIFAVRVSNAAATSGGRLTLGKTVAPNQASSTTPLAWDLTDPATGGSSSEGSHTVYVQWIDCAGVWSKPIALTIDLTS